MPSTKSRKAGPPEPRNTTNSRWLRSSSSLKLQPWKKHERVLPGLSLIAVSEASAVWKPRSALEFTKSRESVILGQGGPTAPQMRVSEETHDTARRASRLE